MIVRKEIDITKPLTPEQIKMLEEMESSPIQYDEDCPPQTEEQLRQMVRVGKSRRHPDGSEDRKSAG